jgi:hypothetical protein
MEMGKKHSLKKKKECITGSKYISQFNADYRYYFHSVVREVCYLLNGSGTIAIHLEVNKSSPLFHTVKKHKNLLEMET